MTKGLDILPQMYKGKIKECNDIIDEVNSSLPIKNKDGILKPIYF